VKVFHKEVAGRLEVEQDRHGAADAVELGEVERKAGAVAAPGSVKPSVSASDAMVEAVPITMQVPAVGMSWSCARPSSTSSSDPAR